MALTDEQRTQKYADSNFKNSLGKSFSTENKKYFEEAVDFKESIFPSQILLDEIYIPAIAAEVPGVVEKKIDLAMQYIAGSGSTSFSHPDLVNTIPFNYGNGTSYVYVLKKDNGDLIPFGQNDWVYNSNSGVLSFLDGLPDGVSDVLPPKITCYVYIGGLGFPTLNEADPIFTASPAGGITGTQITNWDAAFGWDNHASFGYLTSYTETDPIFSASPAFDVIDSGAGNLFLADDGAYKVSNSLKNEDQVLTGARLINANAGQLDIQKTSSGIEYPVRVTNKHSPAFGVYTNGVGIALQNHPGTTVTGTVSSRYVDNLKYNLVFQTWVNGSNLKDILVLKGNDDGINGVVNMPVTPKLDNAVAQLLGRDGTGNLVVLNKSTLGTGGSTTYEGLTDTQTLTGNGLKFVQVNAAGTGLVNTALSITTPAASGGGSLSFSDSTGVFTYTPPDLSSYLTSEVNNLASSVTWANIPISNVPTGTTGTTVALGNHTHSQLHDALTVTDSAEIDFTLTGQDVTASLITGSIDILKLDTGVQTSLSSADTALQSYTETDPVFSASPAFDVIDSGGGTLFLADNGTYKSTIELGFIPTSESFTYVTTAGINNGKVLTNTLTDGVATQVTTYAYNGTSGLTTQYVVVNSVTGTKTYTPTYDGVITTQINSITIT